MTELEEVRAKAREYLRGEIREDSLSSWLQKNMFEREWSDIQARKCLKIMDLRVFEYEQGFLDTIDLKRAVSAALRYVEMQ